MSKFKIGDKVRYLGPTDNEFINPGAIGTVFYVNTDSIYCIDWSSCPSVFNRISWYAGIDEVELVETESPKVDIQQAESSGQALGNTLRNLIDSQLEFKKCWTQVKISTDEYEVVINKK